MQSDSEPGPGGEVEREKLRRVTAIEERFEQTGEPLEGGGRHVVTAHEGVGAPNDGPGRDRVVRVGALALAGEDGGDLVGEEEVVD